MTTTLTRSAVPDPSRLATGDAIQPPRMPPIAGATLSRANAVVDVPSTSWAKMTNVAKAMLLSRLRAPSESAIVRSTGWCQSQRNPSAISALHCGFDARRRAAAAGGR